MFLFVNVKYIKMGLKNLALLLVLLNNPHEQLENAFRKKYTVNFLIL